MRILVILGERIGVESTRLTGLIFEASERLDIELAETFGNQKQLFKRLQDGIASTDVGKFAAAAAAAAVKAEADRKRAAEEEATRQRLQREAEIEARRFKATNATIEEAVNLWCSNRAQAEAQHGHISTWDTSRVTSMQELFRDKNKFNDNISSWDTSYSKWNTSKITNLESASVLFCHHYLAPVPCRQDIRSQYAYHDVRILVN